MSRPWRPGQPEGLRLWVGLGLAFLVLAGLGTLFGLRLHAIHVAEAELLALKARESSVLQEINELQGELLRSGLPEVIEDKAREVLHWGYPEEELVILIRGGR